MIRLFHFSTVIGLVLVFVSSVTFAAENAKVPKELTRLMADYAGNWSITGTVGDKPFTGKASMRIAAGRHCITGTVSLVIDEKPVTFSVVSGWDSSTGWITEQGLVSDGTVYRLPWRSVSPNVDEGELVGTLRGMKVTEKDRLERKGKDDFVVVCTERMEGDEKLPDMTFIYHRVAGEKGKSRDKK